MALPKMKEDRWLKPDEAYMEAIRRAMRWHWLLQAIHETRLSIYRLYHGLIHDSERWHTFGFPAMMMRLSYIAYEAKKERKEPQFPDEVFGNYEMLCEFAAALPRIRPGGFVDGACPQHRGCTLLDTNLGKIFTEKYGLHFIKPPQMQHDLLVGIHYMEWLLEAALELAGPDLEQLADIDPLLSSWVPPRPPV